MISSGGPLFNLSSLEHQTFSWIHLFLKTQLSESFSRESSRKKNKSEYVDLKYYIPDLTWSLYFTDEQIISLGGDI